MRKPKPNIQDLLTKYASGTPSKQDLDSLQRLIADTTYKESIKSALDKDAKQFMDLFELPETTPPDEAFEKIFQKVKIIKSKKTASSCVVSGSCCFYWAFGT